jgi:hypothetical protein
MPFLIVWKPQPMDEFSINDKKNTPIKKESTSFQQMKTLIKKFGKTKTWKWILKLFNLFFTSAVVIYLIYKLTLIGWKNVLDSLPKTVWFYIILLMIYFSLPVFQMFIYGLAFNTNKKDKKLFWTLINKRVLDKDLLGYSGEMYLYLWARKNIKLPVKEILHILKDNVIISSVASTFLAVFLLILFFLFGRIPFPTQWMNHHFFKILLFGFCFLLIFSLIIKFRKSILFLPKDKILAIFALHNARLLMALVLQIFQWWVVMPQVPWVNWFTLLALQIIITRIPFLPSRDLLFLGTGIELSRWIDISSSAIAGMLLASSVINKILNLFFFIAVSISNRKSRI